MEPPAAQFDFLEKGMSFEMLPNGLQPNRQTETAKAAFLDAGGDFDMRSKEIRELPCKIWRGCRVYRLVCKGTRGKGNHVVWTGEAHLWALISLAHFVCPYHVPDIPVDQGKF